VTQTDGSDFYNIDSFVLA